jgi:hypothetical protein
MVRMMIQVPEDQAEQIRHRAKDEGISIAELARQGIEMRLATPLRSEDARRRALSVVGALRSGTGDVSENHDGYFVEAILDHAS